MLYTKKESGQVLKIILHKFKNSNNHLVGWNSFGRICCTGITIQHWYFPVNIVVHPTFGQVLTFSTRYRNRFIKPFSY